jgi:hypothetical protein
MIEDSSLTLKKACDNREKIDIAIIFFQKLKN